MHLGFFVTGAVGFSVVVTRAVGVFSVIGGVQSSLDFFLSGSISSAERLIPLTGFIEKNLRDVGSFPRADHIHKDFFLGFVSARSYCYYYCYTAATIYFVTTAVISPLLLIICLKEVYFQVQLN